MINEKLKELYTSKVDGVKQLANSLDDIDGPLLLKCWEDEYAKSKFKILFVGKECNGWVGYASDNVEECMKRYDNFKLSKNGNRTVFWQYVYWVNSLLNPEQREGNNFLWTNISKFCTLDGAGLEWAVHTETVKHFNCLIDEVKITNPDIVLFFSGPYYDDKMKVQFEGEISFKKVFDDIPQRELARVEHSVLPRHSYRVYHPSSLQRQMKSNYIQRLVEHIKNEN